MKATPSPPSCENAHTISLLDPGPGPAGEGPGLRRTQVSTKGHTDTCGIRGRSRAPSPSQPLHTLTPRHPENPVCVLAAVTAYCQGWFGVTTVMPGAYPGSALRGHTPGGPQECQGLNLVGRRQGHAVLSAPKCTYLKCHLSVPGKV